MRRKILAALATVTVVLTGVVAAPAGAADVAPLEVVVTNRGGGPLDGAKVAVRQGGAVVASGESDARGRLTTNLPTGTYQVTVTFSPTVPTYSTVWAAACRAVSGCRSAWSRCQAGIALTANPR